MLLSTFVSARVCGCVVGVWGFVHKWLCLLVSRAALLNPEVGPPLDPAVLSLDEFSCFAKLEGGVSVSVCMHLLFQFTMSPHQLREL